MEVFPQARTPLGLSCAGGRCSGLRTPSDAELSLCTSHGEGPPNRGRGRPPSRPPISSPASADATVPDRRPCTQPDCHFSLQNRTVLRRRPWWRLIPEQHAAAALSCKAGPRGEDGAVFRATDRRRPTNRPTGRHSARSAAARVPKGRRRVNPGPGTDRGIPVNRRAMR